MENRNKNNSQFSTVNSQLPKGWEKKKLGDVCEKIFAGGDKPKEFSKFITDEFSVPIFANGEKLGYIRRTISHFLAPIMDKGIFYSGKIKAILNDFRDEDERIYLELKRKVL